MAEYVRTPPADFDLRLICPLESSWPALLPLSAQNLRVPENLRPAFGLNPSLYQQDLAEDWQQRARSIAYSEQQPLWWLNHPLFGYPEAYWPGPQLQQILQQLVTERLSVMQLEPEIFQILAAAHVLILPEEIYAEQMQSLRQSWSEHLRQEGYLQLPELISPLQLAALRHYTRQRLESGPVHREDDEYTQRYYTLYDQVINFWHRHLLKVLNSLLIEPVKSSYNVISYYENTHLIPHTDREPCVWNVSLQLDTEPDSQEAWPLWLKNRFGESVAIELKSGDALIYPGRAMSHWRNQQSPGRKDTVILFHFVELDYEGSLC